MQIKDSNYTLNIASTEKIAIETIQTWLTTQISKQLSVSAQAIKLDEPLTRYGLDSIDSVTIVGEMEDWLGTELPSTLLWDYPTIAKAADYLVNEAGVVPAATTVEPAESAAATTAAAIKEESRSRKAWGGLWNRISGS